MSTDQIQNLRASNNDLFLSITPPLNHWLLNRDHPKVKHQNTFKRACRLFWNFRCKKEKNKTKKLKKFLTFLNSIGKPKGKRKEKERLRQCKKIIWQGIKKVYNAFPLSRTTTQKIKLKQFYKSSLKTSTDNLCGPSEEGLKNKEV